MISFLICSVLLIVGYFIYGKVVERIFRMDEKKPTPAISNPDGVDYVPLKGWRVFLIQFLNIAGVGPIIGAIMGAQFGTSSFLWIVFGSIFAGGVHDYLSGMISLRRNGCSLPDIHGAYLGNAVRQFMRVFTIFLLFLVGAVFITTPATLLNANFTPNWNPFIWVGVIIVYYLIATLVPIDKLIGKIYPVFGLLLLIMAVALVIAFFVYQPAIPEIWQGMQNHHPQAESNPIFPMMFISIACGAISGFHATQSPLMARCMMNERQGRPIFYGAMISEGLVALIWAAAASYFFGPDSGVDVSGLSGAAIVSVITNTWFTPALALLAVLGVISAAITTGDTAMRSARLMVADLLRFEQKSIKKRLLIAIPLFAATILLLLFSLTDKNGFALIWHYFAWGNQFLAMVTLWAITIYLVCENRNYWIALIPAIFMSMVTISFVSYTAFQGRGVDIVWAYVLSGLATLVLVLYFCLWKLRRNRKLRLK